MAEGLKRGDRLGLLRAGAESRPSGLDSLLGLLRRCGIFLVPAGPDLQVLLDSPGPEGGRSLEAWLEGSSFDSLLLVWEAGTASPPAELLSPLRAWSRGLGGRGRLFVAGPDGAPGQMREGLPGAREILGGRSLAESLGVFGLGLEDLPPSLAADLHYDEELLAFGRGLAEQPGWRSLGPPDRSGYPRFGQAGDGLLARLGQARRRGLLPLFRASFPDKVGRGDAAGPGLAEWTARLARGGLLDILSLEPPCRGGGRGAVVGAEELLAALGFQGGVEGFRALARPLLLQGSAGGDGLPRGASGLEEGLDAAWQALPLWWCGSLDGGGTRGLRENLEANLEALDYLAAIGKPFEPEVYGPLADFGSDDASCLVASWIAARTAKERGIRDLILPMPLSGSAGAWGIQELAKARALLQLLRELEDGDFRVHLQPRLELDSLPRDEAAARARLAALAALLDDIEPWDARSPEIVHLAGRGGWSAEPDKVEDAIRLARAALEARRGLRAEGLADDQGRNATLLRRTSELLAESRETIASICASIPEPFGAAGLALILSSGYLPLPGLRGRGAELPEALRWRTAAVEGARRVIDGEGIAVAAALRLSLAAAAARKVQGR